MLYFRDARLTPFFSTKRIKDCSETDPRTVDVHIKRLREKFQDSEDFEIETIRGLGYKAVIKR